ncbi:MAG: PEP/pyruvate-binding domain-containing protein [Candidatus Aminicenantes bacterium]|jgi:pyruvate,water dikinase
MRRYTLTINQKLACNEELSGGKGAGLARLIQAGFPVPSGFVVCAPALQEYLLQQLAHTSSENQPFTQETLENIRTRLLDSDLPPGMKNSVSGEYKKLGGKVAVRSSLLEEDSSAGSYAGQLDTVLDVEGEEGVFDAVQKCLSSCFNWRLWKYRTEKSSIGAGGIQRDLSMAVVVQRMVNSQAAGVAFSIDPLTGKNDVIIEATHGLGDKVVQGQVEPDRYEVDDRGEIQKLKYMNTDLPVLSEPNIEKLAKLVSDIAHRIGEPQDVEWAYDGKDFYILQSRPITARHREKIYSCRLVSDMCPGLIKPLLWSTKYRSMIRNVFGRLFRELLGSLELDFARLIIRIHSRVYADMTGFGDLLAQAGLPSNFFEMMTREEKAEERRFSLDLKKLPAMFRLFRVCWRYSRVLKEISRFVETNNQDLDFYRQADWSKENPSSLLKHFDSLLDLHSKSQWYIFIGPMNMTIRNKLISRMVKRSSTGINPSTIISGLVNLKALEPNTILMEIANSARDLPPELKDMLDKDTDRDIREALIQDQQGEFLVSQIDDFLKRYGFLSANGSDFSEIPWIENPIIVWRSIGRLAALPAAPAVKSVERIRDENIIQIRKNLSVPRRLFFDRLLKSTTKYIQLREQTSFLMSEETYLMRRQLLTLAQHLVSGGKIEQDSDIFFLYYDELKHLIVGKMSSEDAHKRIDERKKKLADDAKIDLPVTLTGTQIPERKPSGLSDEEYLSGISVSTGKIQGYARIIKDPTQVEGSLTANDILIIPFTDVGWTPLFPGVGGIIAETGGLLSHTAIIAREYAIPAVVSINKATDIIKDGQPLTVDGDTGRVYLKHIQEM